MILFADIARLADELAREPSKLKKRAAIAAAVSQAAMQPYARITAESAAEAGRFCLYLAGQPFAEADGRKLNAGGAILSSAVKEIAAASDAALSAAYRRHGDLGAAACDLLAPPHGKAPADATLTLDEVAAAFDTMASARTTAARFSAVEGLLRRATALEAKYLLKLMLGDMRIGVAQPLVEEAIAVASGTEVAAVRHAVMLEADLESAVRRAFAGTLAEARMTLFHPLGFMLASPVETPEEAVARFSPKPEKRTKPEKLKAARKTRRKKGAPETPADEAESYSDLTPDQAAIGTDAAAEGFAGDIELSSSGPDREETSVPAPALISHLASLISPPPVHALVEDKFDGMRAQLHCGDPAQPGRVALYSRNREDVTHSFPELQEAFRHVAEAGTGPLILDGEILGWDYAAGKALPFAILGQRIGRKKVDNDLRREIPVVYVAFDVLFHAGELVLPLPLRERRARLEAIALQIEPFTVAPLEKREARNPPAKSLQAGLFADTEPHLDPGVETGPAYSALQRLHLSHVHFVEGADAIDQAYRDARARANEGVMLKSADSPYLAGRRGIFWLKLKRELATLDVVITGAEFGSGRRSQVLSDYTFAIRGETGPDGRPELLNVGKAYSGVTDAEIVELTEWLKAHTLEDFGHFRTVEPLRVLEIAFNNVMRSDRHRSGFALRFPRILRIRDDKPVEDIDTLARVEEIYRSQPDKPGDE